MKPVSWKHEDASLRVRARCGGHVPGSRDNRLSGAHWLGNLAEKMNSRFSERPCHKKKRAGLER